MIVNLLVRNGPTSGPYEKAEELGERSRPGLLGGLESSWWLSEERGSRPGLLGGLESSWWLSEERGSRPGLLGGLE